MMTTYPTTTERLITRAEIDRLTKIIARLDFVCAGDTETIRRLRHEIEVQQRRTWDAEMRVAELEEQLGEGDVLPPGWDLRQWQTQYDVRQRRARDAEEKLVIARSMLGR